jgi:hypothetical protein
MSGVDKEAFSFSGPNPVWDNVVILLKNAVDNESSYAIGEHRDEHSRAWACGRASSLKDFLSLLQEYREENRTDT